MLPPTPLCVVSADCDVRRQLSDILAGQGHTVVQADSVPELLACAERGIFTAVVDPRTPGLSDRPLARLRAEPALHTTPVLMLRDTERAALPSYKPEPAILGLVLRVRSVANGEAQLHLLHEVGGLLTAEPDVASTARNIVAVVADRVEADTVTLFLADGDGGLEAFAAWGYEPRPGDARRLEVGEGVAGWVAQHRQGTIVGDSDLDGRFTGVRTKRSLLAVPVLLGRRLLGVLSTVRRDPAPQFTDTDMLVAGTIANTAAIALESARVHEQARAVHLRLAQVELMRAEERVFLDRLEEYDRLYTQVVSTVSHELKTPLMGIRGFAKLIMEGDLDPSDVVDFAREIHENAVRLSDYAAGILDEDAVHSGRVTLELRPIALQPLVAKVLRALSPVATASHALVNAVPDDLPLVMCDQDKMVQVLTNLVSNAVKYSPDGGRVVVEARVDAVDAEIAVEDEGMGIPEDVRSRVFDRFYRVPGNTTKRIGGTGLGLSIVRGIVELHGGRIEVTSGRGGRGSRFVVTIPRAGAHAADQQVRSGATGTVLTNGDRRPQPAVTMGAPAAVRPLGAPLRPAARNRNALTRVAQLDREPVATESAAPVEVT